MNRFAASTSALAALLATGAAHAHPGHAEAGVLATLLAYPHELLHLLEGDTGMLVAAALLVGLAVGAAGVVLLRALASRRRRRIGL